MFELKYVPHPPVSPAPFTLMYPARIQVSLLGIIPYRCVINDDVPVAFLPLAFHGCRSSLHEGAREGGGR